MRTSPCRYCDDRVVWHQTSSGKKRPYSLTPIPFMPGASGLTLHRTRGLVDAATAWPEPPDMLPEHRCAGWLAVRVAPSVHDPEHAGLAVEEWLTRRELPAWPARRRRVVGGDE